MRLLLPLSVALALAVVCGMPISQGATNGLIYPSEALYPWDGLYPVAE